MQGKKGQHVCMALFVAAMMHAGCDLVGSLDPEKKLPKDQDISNAQPDMDMALSDMLRSLDQSSEGGCATKMELCDGVDNDCDGVVDEGCPCDFGNSAQGVCTLATVSQDSGTCTAPRGYMTQERPEEGGCDGMDNDCDGVVDNDCELCDYTSSTKGVCRYGQAYLSEQNRTFNLTADPKDRIKALCLPPSSYHVDEVDCARGGAGDGVDNDCDGVVDEGCDTPGVALKASDEVCTNGKDDDGDGDVDIFDTDCPLPPPKTPRLDVASRTTCVRSGGGEGDIACFGSSLGDLKDTPAGTAWRAITTGSFFGCALDAQGAPTCWGSVSGFDVQTPSTLRLNSIAAGHEHVCGVSTQGTVSCWGTCTQERCDAPTWLTSVVEVSSGKYHSCARDAAGRVECWGEIKKYQQPPETLRFERLAAGVGFACGIMSRTKHVLCWGANDLLPPPVGNSPENDPEGNRFRPYASISAMWNHVCGLDTAGQTRCWGYNLHGQSSAPASLRSAEVVAGGFHSCSLSTGGELICWGRNEFGQFGNMERPFKLVAKYIDHTCGWDEQNVITCFSSTTKPVRELPLKGVTVKKTDVTSLGVGAQSGCAVIGSDLWCWGHDDPTKLVASGVFGYRVKCTKDACIALGPMANDQMYTYGTDLPLFKAMKEFFAGRALPLADFDLLEDRACVVVGQIATEVTASGTKERSSRALRCSISANYTLLEKKEGGEVVVVDERSRQQKNFDPLPLPLRDASCGTHGCYVVDATGGMHARGESGLLRTENGVSKGWAAVYYDNGELYGVVCGSKEDGRLSCW